MSRGYGGADRAAFATPRAPEPDEVRARQPLFDALVGF